MRHASSASKEHELGTESVWGILMHDAPTGASILNDLSAIVLTVHHAVGSIQGCSSHGTVLHVRMRRGGGEGWSAMCTIWKMLVRYGASAFCSTLAE